MRNRVIHSKRPADLPPAIKSGQIRFLVQKNAQCTETNEKSIFRFLDMVDQNSQLCEVCFFFASEDTKCFETAFHLF